MELVYLWVEHCNNIKNQGFNFSPQFNCKYDEIKNELIIEENKDYSSDFFGKNINITAIIGKNGSGKTSVFRVLQRLLVRLKPYQSIINNTRSFLIYKKGEELYICDTHSKKHRCEKQRFGTSRASFIRICINYAISR